MAEPATAVVVCKCAESAAAGEGSERLRAVARSSAQVHAYAEIDALCHDGREVLAGLLAEGDVGRLVVAACRRPELEAGVAEALAAAGVAPNMFVVADLLGQCRWLNGDAPEKAAAILGRAIARSRHLRPAEATGYPVVRRVLVLGASEAGLAVARECAALGLEVVLAHGGTEARGAPAEGVEALPGTELLGFRGGAGRFEVVLGRQGQELRRQVGAVVVALEPERRADFGLYGLAPAPAVVSLSELENLLATPGSLRRRMAEHELSAVSFLAGLKDEIAPGVMGRVMRSALKVRGLGLPAYILARQVRVAARGLEALHQECRRSGVVFFRFADSFPRLSQEPGGVRAEVAAIDEALTLPVDLPPSLVVVDERAQPSPQMAKAARLLRLATDAWALPQEGNVHWLPVSTSRAGVFVVGRPPGSAERDVAGVSAAAGAVAELLGRAEMVVDGAKVSVDRGRCATCLTCYRLCPHGAVRVASRAEIDPAACQGCGVCAAECPMEAIELAACPGAAISAELAAAAAPVAAPRLVAFCCHRALSAMSRAAGLREPLPVGLEVIEVPCAGKVDLAHLLEALEAGAQGVLVVACHEGNCRGEHGSTLARCRVEEAARLLAEAGLEPERARFATVAPNMGREFLELARSFEAAVAALPALARPETPTAAAQGAQ